MVGIDINVTGYFKRFAGNFLKTQSVDVVERFGCGHGKISAAADADDAVIGFHNFTGAGNDQRNVFVGHYHISLQLAEVFVHTPVFGQLDGGTFQLVGVFFQFAFKAFDECDAVGGGAGETETAKIQVPADGRRSAG